MCTSHLTGPELDSLDKRQHGCLTTALPAFPNDTVAGCRKLEGSRLARFCFLKFNVSFRSNCVLLAYLLFLTPGLLVLDTFCC